MKLGAKEVLGVDIDEKATSTAIENARINGEISGLKFITGDIIQDKGTDIKLVRINMTLLYQIF